MAASKDFAVLDLQNESSDLGVDLQFQDFGEARTQAGSEKQHEQTITFTDFPDDEGDEEELEQDKLMGDGETVEPVGLKAGVSFWNFEFYQQFFDVESKQVEDRIVWSMIPKPGVSYLQTYVRPNPDLYGPFWICMTLAFTTAISGNLSNYMSKSAEEKYAWRYDFHKVSLAASAIFGYAWLVPLGVWGLLVWRGARAKMSLLELLCIYGYSLAIFVPVSILWIVPFEWFKWCLAIVAPVLSGGVLVRTIWPSLAHDTKQVAVAIAAGVLLLHAVLALGFMLYFFSAPAVAVNPAMPIETNKTNPLSPAIPSVAPAAVANPDSPKGEPVNGKEANKSDAKISVRDVTTTNKENQENVEEKVVEERKASDVVDDKAGDSKPNENGEQLKPEATKKLAAEPVKKTTQPPKNPPPAEKV